MATQLLIRHVCDLGKEVQDGDETDIKTFPLNILGDVREIDLCIKCAAEVVSMNMKVIEASRRPGKNGKPPKRTRTPGGDNKIEPHGDGKFHCPICGHVTGESDSGLRLHLKSHHPDQARDYIIVASAPTKTTPPPTKRAAKKAAPRKRTPARR